MDIHIKFRQGNFSKLSSGLKKTKDYIKVPPTVPLVGGSFLVGSANLATNASRKKSDKVYQEKQIQAMNDLTNSLNKVNKNISDTTRKISSNDSSNEKPGISKMIKFKRITNK